MPAGGIETPVQALIHFIMSQGLDLPQYDLALVDKIREKFLITDAKGNEDPADLVGEVIKWEEGDQQYGTLEHTLLIIFTINIRK